MGGFRLHDYTGRFIMCIIYGRHVANDNIREGNEVVCLFTQARAGLGGGCGSLWLHNDSHVVKLRIDCAVPPARTQIDLRQ